MKSTIKSIISIIVMIILAPFFTIYYTILRLSFRAGLSYLMACVLSVYHIKETYNMLYMSYEYLNNDDISYIDCKDAVAQYFNVIFSHKIFTNVSITNVNDIMKIIERG